MEDVTALATKIANIKNSVVRSIATDIFDTAQADANEQLFDALDQMLGKSASISGKTAELLPV